MATDVATVVSSADMAVTDSASPNPVAAGANITYTQVVTNNGPSAGDNATFATPVPANTTLVSIAHLPDGPVQARALAIPEVSFARIRTWPEGPQERSR